MEILVIRPWEAFLFAATSMTTWALVAFTANDLATWSVAITAGSVGFYVALRTAKRTLDQADQATLYGRNRRLRDRVVELAEVIKTKETLIGDLRRQNQELRDQLTARRRAKGNSSLKTDPGE